LKEDVKKMNEITIPKFVQTLEAKLQKNGGTYFIGNKVRNHLFI